MIRLCLAVALATGLSLLSRAATGSVTVAWNPNDEPDLAGYKIHFGTIPGEYPEVIDVGPTCTVTLSELDLGVAYHCVVTAYTTSGAESEFSQPLTVTLAPEDIIEPPVEETPADETPADETPADETPADETPVDEAPVDEAPVDEAPVDEAPVDEAPVDEAPVDEAPVDEAPVDEAPVDEAPVDETPVDETPVDETPVLDPPADGTPVEIEAPALAQPLRVTGLRVVGASVEFELAGPIPAVVRVLASDDLVAWSWIATATPSGTTVALEDPLASAKPRRFYRLEQDLP